RQRSAARERGARAGGGPRPARAEPRRVRGAGRERRRGGPRMIPDREPFERHLAGLCARLAAAERPLFSGMAPPLVARAPGRLDVMGGIADYSGSLVLELPLAVAAFASVQEVPAPRVRVVSASFGPAPPPLRDVSLPLDELRDACQNYAAARAYFGASAARAWAAYVLGALVALRVELGVNLRGGLDVVV